MKIENSDYQKSHMISLVLPVLAAIFLAIGSVVYIIAKTLSNKAYTEKWKDYDECGI